MCVILKINDQLEGKKIRLLKWCQLEVGGLRATICVQREEEPLVASSAGEDLWLLISKFQSVLEQNAPAWWWLSHLLHVQCVWAGIYFCFFLPSCAWARLICTVQRLDGQRWAFSAVLYFSTHVRWGCSPVVPGSPLLTQMSEQIHVA